MAKTSTVTRTSAHHELKLVSTLLNEDGVDLKDINLMLLLAAQAGPGVSTIRRRRKSTVSEAADMMRKKIKSSASFDLKLFVLHWDWKIIQYTTGEQGLWGWFSLSKMFSNVT